MQRKRNSYVNSVSSGPDGKPWSQAHVEELVALVRLVGMLLLPHELEVG
jgi:hypothetical protein